MNGDLISYGQIDKVRHLIRRRLTGNDVPPTIQKYDKERRQLFDIISRTVLLGESNSLLLIGPRGSGKSILLKSVLEEIEHQSANDEACTEVDRNVAENVIKVNLNGLMQTDDKVSLKEITRQMKLENVVADRVFGSFADNLQFLLEALKSGDKRSKSILFILDEFDLFAHHKNQTLLYNLLDIAQSAQAPICVIGLTARMDVTELLEKRVKSRFSHRQIQLFPSFTFKEYLDFLVSYLAIKPDPRLSLSSRQHTSNTGQYHSSDEFIDNLDIGYVTKWNDRVEALVKEPAVLDVLRKQHNLDASIQTLRNLMLLPVCRVDNEHPFLEASEFVNSYKLLSAIDSKSAMLNGVSVTELCLVIAMKHLTDIYHNEPFNFEMVFKEYDRFCQRRMSMQQFDRCIILKAFEHLCALELVRPVVDGTNVKTQREYQLMNLMIDPSEITEVVQKYPNCPTEVKNWACSSINS